VIGGGAAQGICGSGLVDAIAFFLKSGKLTLSGQFARSSRDQSFLISGGVQGITLSARDVDAFQRAKAAIGGGMGYLLSESGMNVADLERVYVCGALGNFLRTDNARAIGLLPDVADEKIMLCGNAVLAGCERLLLSSSRAELCAPITGVARMVNLAESPFESLFIENLYLKPMRLS
jgi:uncharacterized 2Fe-2S/4Fe-4S cluster protein (DUF4445 family)